MDAATYLATVAPPDSDSGTSPIVNNTGFFQAGHRISGVRAELCRRDDRFQPDLDRRGKLPIKPAHGRTGMAILGFDRRGSPDEHGTQSWLPGAQLRYLRRP
jgi:hypothetical protein